jgi:hypothetical protein
MIRLAALAMAVLFATLAPTFATPSFAQVCNDDVPPPPPPADKPVT